MSGLGGLGTQEEPRPKSCPRPRIPLCAGSGGARECWVVSDKLNLHFRKVPSGDS